MQHMSAMGGTVVVRANSACVTAMHKQEAATHDIARPVLSTAKPRNGDIIAEIV